MWNLTIKTWLKTGYTNKDAVIEKWKIKTKQLFNISFLHVGEEAEHRQIFWHQLLIIEIAYFFPILQMLITVVIFRWDFLDYLDFFGFLRDLRNHEDFWRFWEFFHRRTRFFSAIYASSPTRYFLIGLNAQNFTWMSIELFTQQN